MAYEISLDELIFKFEAPPEQKEIYMALVAIVERLETLNRLIDEWKEHARG
jgi:hypothetical protein